MDYQDALNYVGGLSEPSKMPWYSYNIPAYACKTGAKLAEVEGSVCYSCYALKGYYRLPCTIHAMDRHLEALDDLDVWAEALIIVLRYRVDHTTNHEPKFFRWHDSGDIQSVSHLRAIDRIAKELPDITFWLPTREYLMVKEYQKLYGDFAPNLTVRLSGHMVDGDAPNVSSANGQSLPKSVVWSQLPDLALGCHICPARNQGHKCDGRKEGGINCRACWNPNVNTVIYKQH